MVKPFFTSILAKVLSILILFSAISLVFGIIAVALTINMARERMNVDVRAEDVKEALLRAMVNARLGSLYLHKALMVMNSENLNELEDLIGKFQGTQITFNLYIKALSLGTTSEAFKRTDGQLTYQQWLRRGLEKEITIRDIPYSISQLARSTDIDYSGFSRYSRKLFKDVRWSLRLLLEGQTEAAALRKGTALGYLEKINRYEEMVAESLNALNEKINKLTSADELTIQRKYTRQMLALILIGGVLLGLALIAVWILLSKMLLNPVSTLIGQIKKVGDGNISQEITVVNADDEVGDLAQTFKGMLENLKKVTVSKSYLNNVLEFMPDALIVVDSDGKIQFVNRAAQKLLGYTQQELQGSPVEGILAQPGDFFDQGGLENIRRTCSVYNLEQAMVAKNGNEISVLMSCSALRMDDPGEKLEFIFSATDIRERKKAERELVLSMNRYQLLAEMSPVGIFHTDATGRCIYVNKRFCEITGRLKKDVLDIGWSCGLYYEDRDMVFERWQRAIMEKQNFNLEYRYSSLDGKIVWVLGQAVPELGTNDELIGYICTITNVTVQHPPDEGEQFL